MTASSGHRGVCDVEQVLTPEAKDSLKHLELVARRAVEGLLHGIHRSRLKGTSPEFDHHKDYQPGDPIKHIDWRASARHERYYIKRYLADTALGVRIVVDHSGSMLMATEGPTKYLAASRLAASLAYLVLKERNSVGLVLASAAGTRWLPASSAETHLVRILEALVAADAASADGLVQCLRSAVERAERKGIVVLISDMMYDPRPVARELARLDAQGHEILLFQLRDSTEEDFPFSRWVDFRSLEDASARHVIDTVPLRRIYREEYRALVDEWRSWAKRRNSHFVSLRTDESVEKALSEYIAFRARGSL